MLEKANKDFYQLSLCVNGIAQSGVLYKTYTESNIGGGGRRWNANGLAGQMCPVGHVCDTGRYKRLYA